MRKTKQEISRELIDIRRARVLEYLSTGHISHREIASKLNVAHDTIDRDVRFLIQDTRNDIRNHFDCLPLEIKKCNVGLELTIKQLTQIIDSEATEQTHRLAAISARMQAYRFKMDILDGKAQLEEVFAFMDEQQEKVGVGVITHKKAK